MTAREMIEAVVEAVNDSGTLPVIAALDFLDDKAPAASVQQLSGSRWLERYIDGGGVTEVPFAVWLRVPTRDTESRLNAAEALYDLIDALEDSELDVVGTDTPTLEVRDKDGELWRVTVAVRFEQ